MSNERHDEFAGWAEKLNTPGALPGEGLTDKEPAWDKLYDRLHKNEKPRRKLPFIWRFRWVAACLLLAFIGGVILLRNRSTTPPTAQKQLRLPEAVHQPVASPRSNRPSVWETPLQASSFPPAADPADRNPADKKPAPFKKERSIAATAASRQDTDLLINTVAADTSAVKVPAPQTIAASHPAPVRALRVVTLNEVSDPAEQEAQVADRQRHHNKFRFGWGAPGEIRPAMADQPSANEHPFIIRLSSSKP